LVVSYLRNSLVKEYLFFSKDFDSNISFQIFNSQGRQISNMNTTADEQLYLGHLSTGLYMIRFVREDGVSRATKILKL
jgi:hypothetical protein